MKQEPGVSWEGGDGGIFPVLHQLQQHAAFCDVCLLDDEGVSLQAHACVLAAGSPVLRNTLMLKQSLTLLRKQGVTLRISGVTHNVWRVLLQFLYVNKVDMDSDFNVIHSVHRVAKMLGIKSLENLIVTHVEELALQIPLSADISAVNVTVAPTIARRHHHRFTQTDTELYSDNAINTPSQVKNQSVLKLLHVSQHSGQNDLHQSPPNKRLKVVKTDEHGYVQTNNLSTYPILMAAEEEITAEEHIGKDDFVADAIQAKEVKTIGQRKRKQMFCRYCSMRFDKKTALVDHLVETCPKLYKNRKISRMVPRVTPRVTLDVNNGSTSLLKYIKKEAFNSGEDVAGISNYCCFNEECNESFTTHSASMTHLTKCVMKEPFINPRLHLKEVKDILVYDDGMKNLPDNAIEKPTATLSEISANVKMYMCTHCKLRGVKERMGSHLAVVHGKRKPYSCNKCSAKYGYFESFRDHYTSMHTNRTFCCEEIGCDAIFQKKDSLRRHILMDHKREGKETHKCKGCAKTFKYAHHARRHEKYHMGKEDRKFNCITCKKAFVTKQDLERHKDIHTGCKPFKCSQCFYTTARKSNLILHERKHGVVHGDYVCTTCMKYFLSEARFRGHLSALKHEGCRVDKLSDHVVMLPNGEAESVVYQSATEFQEANTNTPLTIERVVGQDSEVYQQNPVEYVGPSTKPLKMETMVDADTDRVVYQNAVVFDSSNATPLTIEQVANADSDLQVVPMDSITSDPGLAQGVASIGNNLVYVMATSSDDLVFNVVDSSTE